MRCCGVHPVAVLGGHAIAVAIVVEIVAHGADESFCILSVFATCGIVETSALTDIEDTIANELLNLLSVLSLNRFNTRSSARRPSWPSEASSNLQMSHPNR